MAISDTNMIHLDGYSRAVTEAAGQSVRRS